MGANDIQHGGSHYKTKSGVQHWDICENYGIGYLESAATKYVYRHEEKNGLEDVQKCLHYTQKLIELHVTRHRLPRGSVPLKVLNSWLLDNEVDWRESEICILLFRWETLDDLYEAEWKISSLLLNKYGVGNGDKIIRRRASE